MTTTLRNATTNDIVKRLTGTPYKTTAETALADGIGNAQLNINNALNDAIAAGYVTITTTRDTTYGRNIRFVTLASGIRHCKTCIDGCDHGTDSTIGCGHLGCWSPNSTNDCPGRTYAKTDSANALIAGVSA